VTGELASAFVAASLFQCCLVVHAICFLLREYDDLVDLMTRSAHSQFVSKEQPEFDISLSMIKICLELMALVAC
jgi:hypothetical protein